jgi:hypothetical protein
MALCLWGRGDEMKEKTYLFKTPRFILVQSIASFIPSTAIAYFLMKLFNEDWGFFWIVLIGIYIFYFAVWFLASILTSLLYNLLWKNSMIDDVYSILVEHKFPNPEDYKGHLPEDYYINIIDDDSLDCELRLKAFAVGSEFSILRGHGQYLALNRATKVHENALDKYKNLHFQDQRL